MAKTVALTNSQIQLHQAILQNLLDTRSVLLLVDPQSLGLEQHIAWNDQVYQVGLAIIGATRAVLTAISGDYAGKLPILKQATDNLMADLDKLRAVNDAIATVGSAFGVITNIVQLLA